MSRVGAMQWYGIRQSTASFSAIAIDSKISEALRASKETDHATSTPVFRQSIARNKSPANPAQFSRIDELTSEI